MNEPIYVMEDNEAIWVPKNENSYIGKFKTAIWIIVAILIIASFIFRANLFSEMSWSTRLLLISLCIGTFSHGGRKKIASPFEIRFYEDYMIVYRNRRYYSNRVIQREFNKFNYKDIKSIVFRTRTQRLNIFGVVEGTWYKYEKDGTLPETPTYHKTTDSITYFYTDFLEKHDIVSTIEKYSPIKVTVENN